VQRSVPKVVQDGVATEADQRRLEQLAISQREHETTMRVAQRADRVIEHDPARRV
jgi:hypothetical protein